MHESCASWIALPPGKTTLVGSVSEIEPLTTEAVMTSAGHGIDDASKVPGKETTTGRDGLRPYHDGRRPVLAEAGMRVLQILQSASS